jgi:hypothetical protein
VLEYLMHRPGIVVTKNKLLEHLYDFNREKFTNVVEVYISRTSAKDRCGVPNEADSYAPRTRLLCTALRHSLFHTPPGSSELAASSPDKPVRIASVSVRAHRIHLFILL